MAQKSKLYRITRSAVRGVFNFLMVMGAYLIVHLAASNVWTALLFAGVVMGGFFLHDLQADRLARVPVK